VSDSAPDRHDLLFAAEMSARYHRRRAAFLETTNNSLNFLTLAGGAGAFVSLYGAGTGIAKALALVLALIGIIQIVFSPQANAMKHKQWLIQWSDLIREIALTPSPTPQQLDDWLRRRVAIETECVVELRALQADCFNRTSRAMGLEETHNYELRWWHRMFMQVIRFEHAFERLPAHADASRSA